MTNGATNHQEQRSPETAPSHTDQIYTAYEYRTLRAPRERESLYRDTYESFGWAPDGVGSTPPGAGSVALKFRRDRSIPNRRMLLELERKAEGGLIAIEDLERSKRTLPLLVAVLLGVIGAAFLAGSIFTMGAGVTFVSVVLGAVGLLAWAGSYPAFSAIRARRSARVIPLIERQYDVVQDSGAQASRLLV